METLGKYLRGIAETLAEDTVESRLVLAILLLALLLTMVAVMRRFSRNRLTRWSEKNSHLVDAGLMAKALGGVRAFSVALGLGALLLTLPLGETWHGYAKLAFIVALTLIGVSLAFHLFNLFFDAYLRKRGGNLQGARARVLLPIMRTFAWVVAIAFILDNMGVKIGTLMAGLGVAGIALGFAAQTVLSDLFSYVAILFDRPFAIGDFIFVGEVRGEVEHVGLKTTRIRSLDGEQIVMSNTDLTNSRVKNFRRMRRRRVMFRFGLEYSTPADTLAAMPGEVKRIIEEVVLATFDRAHFFQFGESSLDFEVVYYVESAEYNDYMDVQQDINLALVRAVEARGAVFAFPTRTVHMAEAKPPLSL